MPETQANIEQAIKSDPAEHLVRAQHIVDAKSSRIKNPGAIRSAVAAGALFFAAACNPTLSASETPRLSPISTEGPTISEVIIKSPVPEGTPTPTPETTKRPLFQKLNIEEMVSLLELGDESDIAGDLNGTPEDNAAVEKATKQEDRQLLSFSQEVLQLKGISYEDQFINTGWTVRFPNESTPAYTEDDYLMVAESNDLKGPFSSIKTVGLYNDTAINSSDPKDFGLRQRLIIVKPNEAFDTKGVAASTNPDEISPLDIRFQEYLKGLLKIPENANIPKFGNPDDPFDAQYYTGSFDLNGRQVGFAYEPEDGTIYITDQATYPIK